MGEATPDALRFLAEESGNVDNSGNFSIQVLKRAVESSHGIVLSHMKATREEADDDLLSHVGPRRTRGDCGAGAGERLMLDPSHCV
jgi:hypothetical protein